MNFSAMHSFLSSFNTRLFEFINGAAGYYHPLDVLFVIATSVVTLIIVGIAVFYYFALYLPWQQEGMARIQAFKRAWAIIVSLFLTWLVVSVTKVLIATPRPFETVKNLHVLISLPASYSFPSGHAALTMALATAVYYYNERLGTWLFLFAFTVGLARIYVGVHYPLDVAVGFLIGYGIPKILQRSSIVFSPKTG
jgi:undecaprenyl-diphosphatase